MFYSSNLNNSFHLQMCERQSIPICIYGNTIQTICINPQCNKSAFICSHGNHHDLCCGLFHKGCQKVSWNLIENLLLENNNIRNQEFKHLNQKMEELFYNIINQVQNIHYQYRDWMKTYGYSQEISKLMKFIEKGEFKQINGILTNKVMKQVDQQKNRRQFVIDELKILEVQRAIKDQLNKVSQIYLNCRIKQNNPSINSIVANKELDSKIIKDLNQVNYLFQETTIKYANLLYRASENNFSASQFHRICDNYNHTLTLLQTQFGKIIGGYTPLSWSSSTKHWSQDKSMQSFIFSLNMKQKFQINLSQFAIACNTQKGPIFGCCDICIVDQANKNKSNAQFPISYNNGRYTKQSDTYMAFTGHPKGKFLIKEWQVFAIQFN